MASGTRTYENEWRQSPVNVRLYRRWVATRDLPKPPTKADLAREFGVSKSQAVGAIWRRVTGKY